MAKRKNKPKPKSKPKRPAQLVPVPPEPALDPNLTPAERLRERLMTREWGLGVRDRVAIKEALVRTITDPEARPGAICNATLALVETMKLDAVSVDQLIKLGLLSLERQAEARRSNQDQLVRDEDMIEGLRVLLDPERAAERA